MKEEKPRTLKQNKSLHLLFQLLAEELNERGLYIGQVIKFESPWNKDRVKELIWREVQKKQTGKESTTQLTTSEINEIFTTIHKAFIEKGIEIPEFPSIESLMYSNL